MGTRSYTWVLLLTAVVTPSFASASSAWYVKFMAGAGHSALAKTQSIRFADSPAPGLTNRYIPRHPSYWQGFLGVSAGRSWPIKKNWRLQLGLTVNWLLPVTVDGKKYPFSNVSNDFDPCNYEYRSQAFAILFTPTLVWQRLRFIDFWAAPEIGVGFVDLYRYRESAIAGSSTAPTTSPFRNHTRTNFAYGVSVGLSKQLKRYFTIGLSYQLLNLGRGELLHGSTQSTSESFQTPAQIANIITLSVEF